MSRLPRMTVVAIAALVAGCEQQPQGGAAPAPAASPAAAAVNDEELATPADFDDEAEKTITPANYKAEVDALEKEIDAEP
jgi:hypothetical protein